MVFAKVHGRFARWSGKMALNEADFVPTQVDVEIDAASIDTGVADRDKHLCSADFLDAERYPKLTFRSKRVEKAGPSGLQITGDLSMHGVTREVVLQAEYGGQGKDPWGNQRVGFTASTSVDRREFGLEWNQVLEAGGVLVGERVDVEIEIQAVQST